MKRLDATKSPEIVQFPSGVKKYIADLPSVYFDAILDGRKRFHVVTDMINVGDVIEFRELGFDGERTGNVITGVARWVEVERSESTVAFDAVAYALPGLPTIARGQA